MPFNLNEFRNKFANGGARPSQFEMQIIWPDLVRGLADVAAAERDFKFLCSVAELPGEKLGTISVPYQGRKLKFVGERDYDALSVTVLNDEDFKVRKALQAWCKAMADRSTTTSQFGGGIASGSYTTDGIVTQLSRNQGGRALAAVKFIGMFPVDVGSIELDWNKSDDFETFTVQFAYQWWESVDPSTGAAL